MASETPRRLRERGQALWKKLDLEINTPEGVLGEEACRIADRIDQIFDLMDGGDDEAIIREITVKIKDYFPAATEDGDVHIHVRLTDLQGELRQQQALLRQLTLAAVGLKKFVSPDADAGKAAAEPDADPAKPGRPSAENATTLSEFSQRRQQRDAS